MTRATLRFDPPGWAITAVVIGCGAFCAAGAWQLNRAEQKRRLLSEFGAGASTDVLTAPVADDEAGDYRYRRLLLTGRYDTQRQFLLDNMVYDGKAGYHVLTPLRGTGGSILVNRGWVPANADRTMLPGIAVDTKVREVSGLIAPLPRPGMRLAAPAVDPSAAWPRRQSFPSADDLREQLEYSVAGYQLLLDATREDGFVRDWQPALMLPEQHLSYAVQWFALALTLLIIFGVVNITRTSGKQANEETG